MECRFFSQDNGACGKGMPVVAIFSNLVCNRKPDKCPVHNEVVEKGFWGGEYGLSGRN